MLSEFFRGNELVHGIQETEEIAAAMQNGSFRISFPDIINFFLEKCGSEVQSLSKYLLIFFCIGLLTTILKLMGKDLKSDASDMAFFACYSGAAAVGINCYCICLEYAEDIISEMTDFITKFSPVLMTLIITCGKQVSAAAFHPVLSFAIYVISIICQKCILPLASYSVILSVADNIGDTVHISRFCKLLSSTAKWILTLSFTLFTGVCGIYGFSASSLDALGAKTVKYAVGSLVPVVGGFLSETLETVVSGGRLMKNTVGSAGMIVLCGMCIVPIIKIGIMAYAVKLSSAVIEPISDKRISLLINGIGDAIITLFAMVATVSVLFLICISIILAATG